MTEPKNRTELEENSTADTVESALGHLWQVANQLSQIPPPPRENYRVTVFGSARIQENDALYQEVKQLTAQLSQQGCDIVTGGGPGLMRAANEGAQLGDPDDKTQSIGIRVELPFEQGVNAFVEQAYSHETFYTRLHQFVRLSDAFVVVAGGIGTTLETLLVWQLLQVRHLHNVPLIMVGKMWRGLLDWAKEQMLAHQPPLASAKDFELVTCVDSIEETITLLSPHIAKFKASRR